jgi:phosphopantetheine--protein transferase-like protein
MNEIIGCGIDIEELSRFKKHLPAETTDTGFLQLIYTEAEIKCNSNILPHLTFPIGFSCKEACFKAFGVSWTNSRISWKDIEIFFSNENDLQEYSIHLNGYALELFNEKKCAKIESYLEYNADYVIFQIILLS